MTDRNKVPSERVGAGAGLGAQRRGSLLVIAALTVLSTACYDQILAPVDESNERVAITNDEGRLGDRVSYPDEDVPIGGPAPSSGGPNAASPALAPSAVRLRLRAEVLPPTVAGVVVQATSVWATSDSRAIVSYNVRGAEQLGGIDYFTRLTNRPRLQSSVLFADSDISGVSMDGRYVYAAQATSAAGFTSPAVLERIRLQGNAFRLEDNLRVGLSSFAATSTMSTGTVIYATTGDDGGVFAFDANDLSLLGEFPLDDARWVAWDEDNARVIVVQGTPGRISVFAEGQFPGGSMVLLNTFPFPGADVPESKSAVDIAGGKAFVAAGPEGVQVMCLDDGQIVGSVPRPDPTLLQLDPSVVVTNAVAVEGDLMFISNGEAGVYAAAGAQDFESSPCTSPQQISVLGQLQFNVLQSANHVEFRDGLLFVAAGLGGLKIVQVSVTP